MHDKHPALIARCVGTADVIASVNFAREHRLLLAVRGGGHNVAGKAMCDDGLVIDLSQMKGIHVDPVNKTARADGGVTWGEFDHETQVFGLATTGGIVPSTGIAGLTLGGGIGYLMRRFGLACDNLLSVDIVTADGQLRRASTTENPDLFWGLRGGGGNFGVVTSLEYQLHSVGPIVLGGLLFHSLPNAKASLQFYRGFTRTAPDELIVYTALMHSPDGHPGVGYIVCYSGSLDKGEAIIKPMREFGPPVMDIVGPMPYLAVQQMLAPEYPDGHMNYWKSNFVDVISDDMIDTMIEHFATIPSPHSAIIFEQLGGAVSRSPSGETAFRERDAPYSFLITSLWADEAENDKNIQWTRDAWQALQPYLRESAYINYLDTGDEYRVEAAYGPDVYKQLVALKTNYDPTNLFRVNQNIQPIH